MKKLMTCLLVVIFLTMVFMVTTGSAQSQTYFHEVTIEMDGEWDLDSNFTVYQPEGGEDMSSNISLVGVGQARIHAITKSQSVPVWWDLF